MSLCLTTLHRDGLSYLWVIFLRFISSVVSFLQVSRTPSPSYIISATAARSDLELVLSSVWSAHLGRFTWPWSRPSLVWLRWNRSRFPGWNCRQLCFLLSWTHCCAGNWMCIWLVPRSGLTARLLGPTFTTSQNVIRSSWLIAFLWYDSTASLLSDFMLMGHRILLMWCQGDVMQTTNHSVGLEDLRSWDCSRVSGQWHVSLIWRFLKMTPRCVRVRCCHHGVVWHLLSQVLILWSCCAVTIPATTASRKLCAGCYGWNLAWWNEPHRLALSQLQKCLLLRRWS